MAPSSFKLNTGAQIPVVGLGTWQSPPGEVTKAVSHALKSGYTHIDCAHVYGNEEEVGAGIKDSGVDRENLFIVSKLWCTDHRRPEQAVDVTLKALGVGYLDLYLMHWPVPLNPNGNHPQFPKLPDGSRDKDTTEWSYIKTWKEMEKLVKTGKVKAIGVSNMSVPFLEDLLKEATIVPAANQVELHPYNPQHELHAYCKEKGILLEAYSPLGSTGSPLFQEEAVTKIAEKNSVEPGTVLLSYLVGRGIVVLPKSVTPARIEKNLKIIDLSEEEMKTLNELAANGKQHRYVKPDWGVDLKFKDWNT